MKILVAGSSSFVGKNIQLFFSIKNKIFTLYPERVRSCDLNALSRICKVKADLGFTAVSLTDTQ